MLASYMVEKAVYTGYILLTISNSLGPTGKLLFKNNNKQV